MPHYEYHTTPSGINRCRIDPTMHCKEIELYVVVSYIDQVCSKGRSNTNLSQVRILHIVIVPDKASFPQRTTLGDADRGIGVISLLRS